MVSNRDDRHAPDKKTPIATTLARIHLGLPVGAPWFVSVVIRSRGFLVATVVVTVLLAGTAAANPDWLRNVDEPIFDWVRGFEGDLSLARVVTQLGSPNLAIAAGVGAVAFMWRMCRASALTLGALVVSALGTDLILKILIDRPRPPGQVVSTQLGSFPSGHTIHAVVIFGLVPFLLWVLSDRLLFLRAGFAVFAIVVALVAWSRVRLGAHWPSDVVASFLIGVSLLIGAEQLLTSTWAAERCDSLGHHSASSS